MHLFEWHEAKRGTKSSASTNLTCIAMHRHRCRDSNALCVGMVGRGRDPHAPRMCNSNIYCLHSATGNQWDAQNARSKRVEQQGREACTWEVVHKTIDFRLAPPRHPNQRPKGRQKKARLLNTNQKQKTKNKTKKETRIIRVIIKTDECIIKQAGWTFFCLSFLFACLCICDNSERVSARCVVNYRMLSIVVR